MPLAYFGRGLQVRILVVHPLRETTYRLKQPAQGRAPSFANSATSKSQSRTRIPPILPNR